MIVAVHGWLTGNCGCEVVSSDGRLGVVVTGIKR